MNVGMRIALALALFMAVAGTVYASTAREWRGAVLLLVLAVAFLYVGLVLRGAVRRASVPVSQETTAEEGASVGSEHIGPTIWPFVFSVAALLLVIGIVGVRWIIVPGAIVFVAAAAGWFSDIRRQHQSSSHRPGQASGSARETPAAPAEHPTD
jgi:Cytochrome c oxidase subunit IV